MEDSDMVEVGLSRLARAPVPQELSLVEQRVLGSISAMGAQVHTAGLRGLRTLAAAGALMMGVVAGALPSAKAYELQSELSPLDGSSALAPSTLLLYGQ